MGSREWAVGCFNWNAMNLFEIKKPYFLGIGGIGMSALARYFNKRGSEVSGYDKTETELTKKLVKEGMNIHYEEDIKQIPNDLDLVVWTPAIPLNNKELQFFRNKGFPLKKRAEVLGMISRSNRTIAVAGTHGKTTTTSILTHILWTGGLDCTAFLGGIARNFGSNYVEGTCEWLVVEADEYDRSFLQLEPEIAMVLSMDPDHLDIYGDAEQMHESGFKEFVKKIKPGGSVFIKNNLIQFFDNQLFETYGVGEGNCRAVNIRVEDGWFVFDYFSVNANGRKESCIKNLRLALPGRHNVENATAAIAVALQLGISRAAIKKALATFEGVKRRFEFVYRDERVVFIDDYAHHPSELKEAIAAARALFPGRKITGIFQPHLYSRTRDFQDDFAVELDNLDELLLMDIYPARERPIPGVDSAIIFEKMKNPNKELVSKATLLKVLSIKELEVLLTLGAGDIDTFVEPIKNLLSHKSPLLF